MLHGVTDAVPALRLEQRPKGIDSRVGNELMMGGGQVADECISEQAGFQCNNFLM
jgi:hypothetical protein